MIRNSYLTRLHHRREEEQLKQAIIFGLAVGWVMTLTGCFHYYFLLDNKRWLWTCEAGLLVLAITVLMPKLITYPQNLLKVVGGFVATQVAKALIAVAYFLVVLPAGLIMQHWQGTKPFYSWAESPPVETEGWVDKSLGAAPSSGDTKQRKSSMFADSFQAVQYFTRHGQLILLPCLVMFLVFGLVGVLVQSSAVAPLIYTLF